MAEVGDLNEEDFANWAYVDILALAVTGVIRYAVVELQQVIAEYLHEH
jgi:hypothetical protein